MYPECCYNCGASLSGKCKGLTPENQWLCMRCLCEYLALRPPEGDFSGGF